MTRSSARPSTTAETSPVITLRALHTHAEYSACVQLQRETWGTDYVDLVPSSILKVSQKVGGVSGGAFTADGRMVGFVYGMTGIRDGHLIHWSHMLAVASDFRNHGVGRRLKEYQRAVLGEMGVEMMYWTFDPLVARNAHLNLNRLGAEVQEYVPDMYGDTGSELHAFGTDRFVVRWPVASLVTTRVATEPPAAWHAAPVTSNGAGPAATAVRGVSEEPAADAPVVRIEVPADIEGMAVADARAWREMTRPSFVRLLGDGYRVAGFLSDGHARCYYVLTRPDTLAGGR
ncbi:MAG: hypothetical protein ACREKM_11805 [Longimicrobiales bacterium]